MRATSIYINYLKIVRAIQIARIIMRQATEEMMSRTSFGRWCRKRKVSYAKPVYTTEERLRITIEDLGPTYIKFGQILADRPDVISERFRNELKKLQSRAQPFDDKVAINIIEDELKGNVDDIFAHFDHNCLASASIGQVYSAVMHDGAEVIVKVRRPNVDQKIKLDLYLMRYLAAKLAKEYPEMAAINIVAVVDEFGESIVRELDYCNEAANIQRFAEMFADDTTVHIPKVYLDLSTRKVLVMEKVAGITPDDPQVLRDAGLNTTTIAMNGTNIMMTMILRYGFFHADPHAGNIFIMPGNVVGLIDFGMVGVLAPRDMDFIANLSMSFVRHDAAGMADALIKLCGVRFFSKRDDLIFSLQQLLEQYKHVPLEQLDLGRMMQQSLNLITKYSLQIPSGIFLLVKALATIQKVAEKLDPNIPFTSIVMPYATEVVTRKYEPKRLANELYHALVSYGELALNLPTDVSEILYCIKQGQITHDVRFRDADKVQRSIRGVGIRLGYSFVVVGMFIGSILLVINRTDLAYAEFLLWISSVLIFILIISWSFKKR